MRATVAGFLNDGLGALADDAAWHEGQIIKFEWVEADGFVEYVCLARQDTQYATSCNVIVLLSSLLHQTHRKLEFQTTSDPFVDRTGTNSGSKSDNQLFAFNNFTTTHTDLESLLLDAGGVSCCAYRGCLHAMSRRMLTTLWLGVYAGVADRDMCASATAEVSAKSTVRSR